MTSATKIRTSCYTYKGWTIELVEGNWLMFPQGESDPTDAANSKRDAMAMVDNWETLKFNPFIFVSVRV